MIPGGADGGAELLVESPQRPLLEDSQPETRIASQQGGAEPVTLPISTRSEASVGEDTPSAGEDAPIVIVEPRDVASPARESISPIDPTDPILREEPRPKQIAAGAGTLPDSSKILVPLTTPAADEVTLARWVTGKQNYVYSPFAASNQVVDVEGYAPGTLVKCPYSGKVFAVPEREPSPQE